MRTIVLVALLGLVCLSQGEVLRGSILTFTSKGELKQSTQSEQFHSNDIMSLYKHSMGLPLAGDERKSEKIVAEYQRGDVFNPSQMNYMIIMEGLNQDMTDQLIARQRKISLSVEQGENKLLDSVYDSRNEQSINYQLQKNFVSQEDLSVYYFSQTNVNNKYFQNFGFSIKQNQVKKMQLVEVHSGKSISKPLEISKCFDSLLGKQFYYISEKNTIVKKNGGMKLEISEENLHDVSVMIEEICGSLHFSKLLIPGERPNFVTFHFSSLRGMTQKLNQEQIKFVLDMWKVALNQLIMNFQSTFGESTLGTIIYPESQQVSEYIIESGNLQSLPHNLEFAEIRQTIQERRVLSGANENVVLNTNYQIRVWFSIFFGVMIYFVLYALVTAKNDRDSLLYAKFLTNDIKN